MNKIDEIQKLKSLLDQGAITDEEFQTLKKEILSKSELIKETDVLRATNSQQPQVNNVVSTIAPLVKNQYKRTIHVSGKPFFSKTFKISGIVILIFTALFIIGSPSTSWKKKQFNDYDEIVKAFKWVKYDDVKAEFGEPTYKFLDLQRQEITYKWSGVGVKGHGDAALNFDVLEIGGVIFKGFEFKTVETHEGYYAPSNDKDFNID